MKDPRRFLPSLLLVLALLLFACSGAAAKPRDKTVMERGATVRLLRDVTLTLFEQPFRAAKKDELFEVLEVRPAAQKAFLVIQKDGALMGAAVPLDSVALAEGRPAISERSIKTDALFAGIIPVLKITIDPPQMERLRKEPRNYVEATLEEAGGKTLQPIGLKLKGSAGSFQGIDARPGFSINTDKFKGASRFHGLKRFQLNNCVQDGTALNEILCGEMARKAGVPASRCTHALVTLNGRDLGIYVLKEGFTEDFLAAYFTRTDGHLYDGGFLGDIRMEMELDQGDPADKARLTEFVGAIAEGNPDRQQERMAAIVDIDAFMRFVAMESLFSHWDGYAFNRNNYRIYENPATGRFHFILHGMDQMFGDLDWNMHRQPTTAVGNILWRNLENRKRYTAQLFDVYEKVVKPIDWGARAEEIGQRLLKVLEVNNPGLARAYPPNINSARDRLRLRMNNVRRQLEGDSLLKALATQQSVDLGAGVWLPQMRDAEGRETEAEGRRCFYIKATGPQGNGSWRLPVRVPAGRYRFEALIKLKGVQAISASTGEGAGLRVSGGDRTTGLRNDTGWQKVSYDLLFEGDQVLVAELRAMAGEMWIDRGSLMIVKAP